MLIADSVNHFPLTLDLFHLHRVSLAECLRDVELIGNVGRLVLVEPAHGCGLDPSAWLRLHLSRCLVLHCREPAQVVETAQSFKVLGWRDNDNPALLVDLHEGFHSGTIDSPRVLHSIPFEPVLGIDLINDLEQQLLHHEWGWLSQVDPVVEIHSLRRLRVPHLLRNQLA